MRLAVLVLIFLAAVATGGCGGAELAGGPEAPTVAAPPQEQAGGSGLSETGGSGTATRGDDPGPPAPSMAPPAIVLDVAGTQQEAVQGSFCVTKIDPGGQSEGVCSDSGVQHPKHLSVVPPGAHARVRLADGAFARHAEGCRPDCRPTVTVFPLGCEGKPTTTFELPADGRWVIDLEPGAYELQVFGRFEAPGGSSGDTSGVLGLLVDRVASPEVVDATAAHSVCS
jgi:hypothetical protein